MFAPISTPPNLLLVRSVSSGIYLLAVSSFNAGSQSSVHLATRPSEDLPTAPNLYFGCFYIIGGLHPCFFRPARPNDFHRQRRTQASRNVSQFQASLLGKSALLSAFPHFSAHHPPASPNSPARANRSLSREPDRLLPWTFSPFDRHAAVTRPFFPLPDSIIPLQRRVLLQTRRTLFFCSLCILILRRDLILHSHGALLPAPTPRRLLDGRPPRIHRRWRPRLRSFGPSRHRQATRARHCRPGLERCRCLPGATAADSPIRSDYAMSTAPVVPDAPAPRATASPPPPHIFSKIKKSVPGIQCFTHSPQNLPRGRHRGLVRVHLFPPVNACSHRYSGQSMGHPLPPSLARRRARHPGGHNSWVVPFASDLTTRGPGGARAESNRTLG